MIFLILGARGTGHSGPTGSATENTKQGRAVPTTYNGGNKMHNMWSSRSLSAITCRARVFYCDHNNHSLCCYGDLIGDERPGSGCGDCRSEAFMRDNCSVGRLQKCALPRNTKSSAEILWVRYPPRQIHKQEVAQRGTEGGKETRTEKLKEEKREQKESERKSQEVQRGNSLLHSQLGVHVKSAKFFFWG